MPLVRWDPFKDLERMQERMEKLFGDYFWRPPLIERELRGEWLPPADIYEDQDNLVIKVDLPEMDMKDIDVKIENNTLRIRGERKLEKEEKKENYHRIERYYGTFSRSFTLPTTVDQEKVTATYDRGVLKVVLPKKEETKPKQIKVEIK